MLVESNIAAIGAGTICEEEIVGKIYSTEKLRNISIMVMADLERH